MAASLRASVVLVESGVTIAFEANKVGAGVCCQASKVRNIAPTGGVARLEHREYGEFDMILPPGSEKAPRLEEAEKLWFYFYSKHGNLPQLNALERLKRREPGHKLGIFFLSFAMNDIGKKDRIILSGRRLRATSSNE